MPVPTAERAALGPDTTKPAPSANLKFIVNRRSEAVGFETGSRGAQQPGPVQEFEGMLGASPQMQEIFSSIRKVATTDAPVLMLGESGTGKEMAAFAIHQRSARCDGPFVAVNCSAIPETLLESELFGHEKGAFTGAHVDRKGRMEMAAGGTLFLDEIGELPLAIQVKLLRFLQDRTIERVGARQPIRIDTRVIAATNVDLSAALQQGAFRQDLYYRLAVVVLEMSPLRERRDDIPLLAGVFLRKHAAENGKAPAGFSPDALQALQHYRWPGNVRELENRVRRALIMSNHNQVTAADLELAEVTLARPVNRLKEARELAERLMIERALLRHNGKISPAAAELGISRPTLYELMAKLGIRRQE